MPASSAALLVRDFVVVSLTDEHRPQPRPAIWLLIRAALAVAIGGDVSAPVVGGVPQAATLGILSVTVVLDPIASSCREYSPREGDKPEQFGRFAQAPLVLAAKSLCRTLCAGSVVVAVANASPAGASQLCEETLPLPAALTVARVEKSDADAGKLLREMQGGTLGPAAGRERREESWIPAPHWARP